MIDEKKIEEAVNELYNSNAIFRGYDQAEIGFKSGIRWFLDNLWHDASEEPKEHCDIFVECLDGANTEYAAYRHNSAQLWNDFVDRSHTTRWLYIEDLMKGGK